MDYIATIESEKLIITRKAKNRPYEANGVTEINRQKMIKLVAKDKSETRFIMIDNIENRELVEHEYAEYLI